MVIASQSQYTLYFQPTGASTRYNAVSPYLCSSSCQWHQIAHCLAKQTAQQQHRLLTCRSKFMLFGQVKGPTPRGRPKKVWNNVVLSDFHKLDINCPYRDAQNRPAWRDRTWGHTHLAHVLECVIICYYLLSCRRRYHCTACIL